MQFRIAVRTLRSFGVWSDNPPSPAALRVRSVSAGVRVGSRKDKHAGNPNSLLISILRLRPGRSGANIAF